MTVREKLKEVIAKDIWHRWTFDKVAAFVEAHAAAIRARGVKP